MSTNEEKDPLKVAMWEQAQESISPIIVYLVSEIKRLRAEQTEVADEIEKLAVAVEELMRKRGKETLQMLRGKKELPALEFSNCSCGLSSGHHAEGCPSYPGWADPGGSGVAPEPLSFNVGGSESFNPGGLQILILDGSKKE